MTMLRQFTGYRGVAALVQIGEIKFLIVAKNAAELEEIYQAVLPEAGAFNPEACAPSVVISSKILPDPSTKS